MFFCLSFSDSLSQVENVENELSYQNIFYLHCHRKSSHKVNIIPYPSTNFDTECFVGKGLNFYGTLALHTLLYTHKLLYVDQYYYSE